MKKKTIGAAKLFLLLPLGMLVFYRHILYDVVYGFDDQKCYRGEIAEYRLRTSVFPNDSAAHYELANLLCFNMQDCENPRQRYAEAAREYKETIRLDPTNDSAYSNLGHIYELQFHDYQTAETLYRKSLAVNPNSSITEGFLARNYQNQGKTQEAEKHQRLSDQLMQAQYQQSRQKSGANLP